MKLSEYQRQVRVAEANRHSHNSIWAVAWISLMLFFVLMSQLYPQPNMAQRAGGILTTEDLASHKAGNKPLVYSWNE